MKFSSDDRTGLDVTEAQRSLFTPSIQARRRGSLAYVFCFYGGAQLKAAYESKWRQAPIRWRPAVLFITWTAKAAKQW